ncbi:MAG: class I SAM-dependent methyltransferase [Anaerolineae bacterium]
MSDESRTTLDEIQSRVDRIQWFHDWQLVPGVRTRGTSPMVERAPFFQIPEDLRGKRVLDIGCADGFFTFLAESRGAEVVAIDSCPRQGFFLAHEVLGSRVEFHQTSIYDLTPAKFGLFDIVFFFGVYYHLRNPLLALERIANVTTEWALIESEVMASPPATTADRRRTWLPFPRKSHRLASQPEEAVSYFFESDNLWKDPSNWWVPNIPCLLQTVRSAGFPKVELVSIYHSSRGIVRAVKGPRTSASPLTEDIFVAIDVPQPEAEISGPVEVAGWALSQMHPDDGVDEVWVYLDELDERRAELGKAHRGSWRADQAAHFGDRYGACGYQFYWDPVTVPPGDHTLYILAKGKMGWNHRSVSVVVG